MIHRGRDEGARPSTDANESSIHPSAEEARAIHNNHESTDAAWSITGPDKDGYSNDASHTVSTCSVVTGSRSSAQESSNSLSNCNLLEEESQDRHAEEKEYSTVKSSEEMNRDLEIRTDFEFSEDDQLHGDEGVETAIIEMHESNHMYLDNHREQDQLVVLLQRNLRMAQDPLEGQKKRDTECQTSATTHTCTTAITSSMESHDNFRNDICEKKDDAASVVVGSSDELSKISIAESNVSDNTENAKELILSVTKEEDDGGDDDDDEDKPVDFLLLHGKGQDSEQQPNTEMMTELDSAAHPEPQRANTLLQQQKTILESNAIQNDTVSVDSKNDNTKDGLANESRRKQFPKPSLLISTTAIPNNDVCNSADIAMKSPIRCESPGMRRRREELDKSQRSIRKLEEQMSLGQVQQPLHQQSYPQEEFQFQSQSQNQHIHQLSNHLFDACELQDCGQSVSSTTTSSTASFGLLYNSSRTLLMSSNANMAHHHNHRNFQDDAVGSDALVPNEAVTEQIHVDSDHKKCSSPPLSPHEDPSVAHISISDNRLLSNGGTPKAANRSSPGVVRSEDGKDMKSDMDAIKAYYEKKIMQQRRSHEDQIDEIIEKLNYIESTYGNEISSLKKRLAQKEIMMESLTNSLSEMKQQYDFATAELEETKHEIQAGNERCAALRYQMECEKIEAVETACNEIRDAAESQFAAAQKKFIKLKQDYAAACEHRNALKKQCDELIGKVEAMETRERAYENKISKLMTESAETKAQMATEKAEALKMNQVYTEKVQAYIQKEKELEARILKSNRDCKEAYALAEAAIKEKEALKKENAELQSVCEELMTIVEARHNGQM